MAKDAGMKYITITASITMGLPCSIRSSDYTIVKKTPYGKDVLKMLADECKNRESSYFSITRSSTGIIRIIFRVVLPE